MTSVTAFAPATVSNVACGFDVLGFALEAPGDEVTARFASSGVSIEGIEGDEGRLPREAASNTAGVAALALLARLGERRGVVLSIRKGLPLSSGLGGSAASAAAAVVAVDALFGAHSSTNVLISCALEGERLGAGSAHADNIAPSICGGFVLVRCPDPPDVLRLPVPPGLTAVVIHPALEIETAKARALLGTSVPLADAVRQWANMGALVDGLHRGDFARDLACPRGHHCRAAPGAADSRARGDQTRGRRSGRPRLQHFRLRAFALCPLRQHGARFVCRRGHDGRSARADRRRVADLRLANCFPGCARSFDMSFVTTRAGGGDGVSFLKALLQGLAPDGGLYVPETIEPWLVSELERLPTRSLTEIAYRALRPYTRGELDATTFEAVIAEALNFPIPVVEVEPGIYALELFHGPTLAFKDVGARTMARLMAALDTSDRALTVLVATSGDTGSAVAHAFHGVPHTRVVVLYPEGRVSPTQEAQLTMFNAEAGNVRAYAVAGSFDDCHRLTREAFGDAGIRARVRLTSANSVNIGRLLPQTVYYFHAVARVAQVLRPAHFDITICTPSGNFGNLTAGLMAKRAGLPIGRFVAATNVNDVVPEYLRSGRFEPRPSVRTLANAMDVGNPSNFERMQWLYGGDVNAMRHDMVGSRYEDAEVRTTIKRVYQERGYLLDPLRRLRTGPQGGAGQVGPHEQWGMWGYFWRPRIRRNSARSSSQLSAVPSICRRRSSRPSLVRRRSSGCRRRSTPLRALSVGDDSRGRFRYRAEVLEELWRYGVQPTERTPPSLVHEFVSDLYRYEIRRLRARLLRKEFPKKEYAGRVVDLRQHYRIIAMHAGEWAEPS